jgi:hypothetical protein
MELPLMEAVLVVLLEVVIMGWLEVQILAVGVAVLL